MSQLYVCKEYETPYSEGYRVVRTIEEHNKIIYNQALEDILKLIATLGIDWEVKNSDIEWLEKSIQGLRK